MTDEQRPTTTLHWTVRSPHVPLWVDIQKMDAAWRDSHLYIPINGMKRYDDGVYFPILKYTKVGEWLSRGIPTEAPDVGVDAQKETFFSSGRHRFAWVRDHGATATLIETSESEVEKMRLLFGSSETICRVWSDALTPPATPVSVPLVRGP